MPDQISLRRLASRAIANLVAVIAISAIFGLKAYIDMQGVDRRAEHRSVEFALFTDGSTQAGQRQGGERP